MTLVANLGAAWLVVAAALGASSLTLVGQFGFQRWRDREEGRAERMAAIEAAVTEMSTAAIEIYCLACALRDSLKLEMGRGRAPNAPGEQLTRFGLHDRSWASLRRAFDAQATLLLVATPALTGGQLSLWTHAGGRAMGVATSLSRGRPGAIAVLLSHEVTSVEEEQFETYLSAIGQTRSALLKDLRSCIGNVALGHGAHRASPLIL